VKITYHGHSCFEVRTDRARLIIDPFLTGNPAARITADAVECDYILLSHGHDDHVGDALSLAQRCCATIIANFEIAEYFAAKGAKTHGLNPGGGHDFPFGRVKLTLARHSSSLGENPLAPVYLGEACGLLITADGRKLYHAGDTALFLDLQLVGREGVDLAMLPIGDNYTMGPDDALTALDLIRPKLAVPMHYNTWPVIAQDAAAFARRAGAAGHRVQVLVPGGSLEI
jgi:L-ascorbate metabolism protein UlaG (beta-lactamase superfamily)